MDNFELKAIILDFDGTVCQIFKNYNTKNCVLEMQRFMKYYNIEIPSQFDFFDIFDIISKENKLSCGEKEDLYIKADKILTKFELEAIDSSEIVNGFNEVIYSFINYGYLIGLATNNSAKCVYKFFEKNLDSLELPVIGRISNHPELLKPNNWSLMEVLKIMKVDISNSILVGDSLRDYECAVKSNCKFIGMAPTEKKLKRLQTISPKVEIAKDFYELKHLISEINKL